MTLTMSMADPSSPTSLKGATTSSEDQENAFLQFVEYARSMLSSNVDEDTDAGICDGGNASTPPWSWVVSRILKSCVTYSSGVTPAILLSDLFQVVTNQPAPSLDFAFLPFFGEFTLNDAF